MIVDVLPHMLVSIKHRIIHDLQGDHTAPREEGPTPGRVVQTWGNSRIICTYGSKRMRWDLTEFRDTEFLSLL